MKKKTVWIVLIAIGAIFLFMWAQARQAVTYANPYTNPNSPYYGQNNTLGSIASIFGTLGNVFGSIYNSGSGSTTGSSAGNTLGGGLGGLAGGTAGSDFAYNPSWNSNTGLSW